MDPHVRIHGPIGSTWTSKVHKRSKCKRVFSTHRCDAIRCHGMPRNVLCVQNGLDCIGIQSNAIQWRIYLEGSFVKRMYPLPEGTSSFLKPNLNFLLASSSLRDGTTWTDNKEKTNQLVWHVPIDYAIDVKPNVCKLVVFLFFFLVRAYHAILSGGPVGRRGDAVLRSQLERIDRSQNLTQKTQTQMHAHVSTRCRWRCDDVRGLPR